MTLIRLYIIFAAVLLASCHDKCQDLKQSPAGEILEAIDPEGYCNYTYIPHFPSQDTLMIENDKKLIAFFGDSAKAMCFKNLKKHDFSQHIFLVISKMGYYAHQNLSVFTNHDEKKVTYSAVEVRCKKDDCGLCLGETRPYMVKIPIIPAGYRVEYHIAEISDD